MAQIITNQASINYEYNGQTGSSVSNVATATLVEPLSVQKVSIEDVYRFGDELTYSVSVLNSSGSALTNVTVVDNLGSNTVGGVTVTPLTYSTPAILFIDGVFSGNITPTVADNQVTFTIPTLASGSRAQILYKAVVNEFAPLEVGAEITNTATVTANGVTAPVSAENTVTADSYAEVTITKTMSPSNVVDGEPLTYTFVINNYGNAEVTNIVLRDAFNPAPENITVQVDGVAVPATDYTYENGVLTLPAGTTSFELSLPAATITRDPVTGLERVTPSSLTVTVVGVL